jgi:transposase InsO family protein
MRAFVVAEAERLGVSRAARNIGVSRNTVYRWRRRTGELEDRPCRPHRSPRRTSEAREAQLLAARMEWRWGPDRIGPLCGLSRRTAYRILRRYRMHRLREIFPAERVVRGTFHASAPGEVLQVDIKSLGRLTRGGGRMGRAAQGNWVHRPKVGWEHAHVAVDAASRKTFIELRPGFGRDDCVAFLERAIAHFDAVGIRVRRVLTDNGVGYLSGFDRACAKLGVRHTRTKPYHPWTNGRAERFIRTLQRECLYVGRHFASDEERRYAIALWLASYNADRPHTALGGLSPDQWLALRIATRV